MINRCQALITIHPNLFLRLEQNGILYCMELFHTVQKDCRNIAIWWLRNVTESLLQNSNNVKIRFLLYYNKTFQQYCNVIYLGKLFTKTLK